MNASARNIPHLIGRRSRQKHLAVFRDKCLLRNFSDKMLRCVFHCSNAPWVGYFLFIIKNGFQRLLILSVNDGKSKKLFFVKPSDFSYFAFFRSEERRVGKECRSRW